MTVVLVTKILMLSLIWTGYWVFTYSEAAAPIDRKTLSIAFAPWIVMFVCIMLFWW
jgi:hypothetical protein